jgi:hypothetical protein
MSDAENFEQAGRIVEGQAEEENEKQTAGTSVSDVIDGGDFLEDIVEGAVNLAGNALQGTVEAGGTVLEGAAHVGGAVVEHAAETTVEVIGSVIGGIFDG